MSNPLLARRQELELLQADVAREVGVSQPLLSQWEKGDLSWVVEAAVKLSRLYKTPMEELFGPLVDAPAKPSPVKTASRPPRKRSGTNTRAVSTAPKARTA